MRLSWIASNSSRLTVLRSVPLGRYWEQLSIPVDRGVSGDLRFGVLIAV